MAAFGIPGVYGSEDSPQRRGSHGKVSTLYHPGPQDQPTKTIHLKAKHEDSPFTYPVLELRGRVADIFTFYQAEWISGLTCRVKYNGKRPLPSRVFFSEYDENGKQTSERIRLIYPRLNSGESGGKEITSFASS